MKHIISADQFSKKDILEIINLSKKMDEILASKKVCKIAEGKILATFFYEPSTRTRLSFETAMNRLGGKVISTSNVNFSSVTKGETIEDSAKVLSGYADVIALRSPEIGYAERAAKVSTVPILNGGDGAGEHPTQSFLDLYTISKYFDLEQPIIISFIGDLKYGRTVHSLSKMLRHFPQIKINFIAPEEIQIPAKYFKEGDGKFHELTDEILATSDVIYDTRIQKERFEDMEVYEKNKSAFILTKKEVEKMKEEAILMHPLPRVDEISPEVDELPQAKYFEQARNGVPTRMALIAYVLGLNI